MSAWQDVAGAHEDARTRRSNSTAGGAPMQPTLNRTISQRSSQSNPLWDSETAGNLFPPPHVEASAPFRNRANSAANRKRNGSNAGPLASIGGPKGRVYVPRRAGAPVPVPLPAGPHPDDDGAPGASGRSVPLPEEPHPDDVARRAREARERLPAGWEQFSDDVSGQAYFYHADSGTTTWIRPTAAPLTASNLASKITVSGRNRQQGRVSAREDRETADL